MNHGWPRKPLSELCDIVNGGTPKTDVAEYWDGAHKWITPAEMGKRASPYVSETKRTLTDAGIRSSSAKPLTANSVILSSRAPIGHLVINTVPMATNQGCKGLIPDPSLNTKFLYYYLSSITDELEALGTGTTFKELSGGKLKEVLIPVPPVKEQTYVTALLDEAFEGIAAARANAERNVRNASLLSRAAAQSMLSPNGTGWTRTTIGQQATLQRGFDITKAQQRDGHIPVVSSGGIRSFHDTAAVHGPGVILGRKGTLGTVYYVDGDYWPHDTTLWVKDFHGNDPRFVYHFFVNLDVQHLDSGAANPALNRNQVHPIVVDWPDRSEQVVIAKKLDDVAAGSDRLTGLYQQKLAAFDELKQSLLHHAFTGQLTERTLAAHAV